jgi:hypothetical protein
VVLRRRKSNGEAARAGAQAFREHGCLSRRLCMEQGNSFGEEVTLAMIVGCATFLLCLSFNYASDIFPNFAHVSIGTSESQPSPISNNLSQKLARDGASGQGYEATTHRADAPCSMTRAAGAARLIG